MDFNDSADEAAFREEARCWLSEHFPTQEELSGLNDVEQAKLWQKRKFDANWACIGWPKEHGGRGANAIEQVIWEQEEGKYLGGANLFTIGQGMCAPTLMVWGREADCERYLPKIASGEEVWCQLFSEPAGGSDLAALRTTAVRDGDDWIINGQKIWTSYAHFADYAVLVVRTDPNVAKHRGLSYFFVDMKSPGIEVKQIKKISGDSDFNEVFLSNVRVPDSQRLGEVGQGWQVALTTLMNERSTVDDALLTESGFDDVYKLASRVCLNNRPAIENDAVRVQLANWYCQEAGLRYTAYRSVTALSKGDTPGPENSISKLVGAVKQQDMSSFALDLMDAGAAVWDPNLSDVASIFHKVYLDSPGLRIAGGTDEILSNIIAERVLGLPQDMRADKGMPFSEVPISN